jgi:hypothetical protein
MHVPIHGQGICRPLGIKRHLPEADLVPVAEFVKNDVHIFGAKKHIAGVTLAAEADWGGTSPTPSTRGPLRPDTAKGRPGRSEVQAVPDDSPKGDIRDEADHSGRP